MSRRLIPALVLAVIAALPALAGAEDKKPALSAALVDNSKEYKLDPATSGEAFRKGIAKRDAKPPASKVDMIFRITNNTDKDIALELGGDASQFKFDLKGNGAVTVDNLVAMTMEFRMGTPVTIKPGKTHDIALKSLAGGARGIGVMSYFTEAGDYQLAATLHYGESKLTSDTITVKVAK